MYSSKENVNILTALLVAHGIRHAVVCPGSRNSAIVHNLNECPHIQCYPVTDERSAGFYALGMTQATGEPVVVCVTSGTALLNLYPAVAEAYYQHRPLVVVSADRPAQWIDQLDGQTLPQPDALGRFVGKAVSLPEPHDAESRWYCNRLVNEALIVRHAPVHINVPISEPLFEYSVPALPDERKIELLPADMPGTTLSHVLRMFMQSKRPMLITGQPMNPNLDEAVSLVQDDDRYVPDFVLYIGDSIVSKRVKHFLRKAKETWAVNWTGEVNDTFQNLTHVIQGDGEVLADQIRFMLEGQPHPFVQLWEELLLKVREHRDAYHPAYSQMSAVKYLEGSNSQLSTPILPLRQQHLHPPGEYLCQPLLLLQPWRQRYRGLTLHSSRLLLCHRREGHLRHRRPQFLLRPERPVEPEPAWQSAHPPVEQWQGWHLQHAPRLGTESSSRSIYRCIPPDVS